MHSQNLLVLAKLGDFKVTSRLTW